MNRYLNDWDFALFSANLHTYMPAIGWPEHPEIYTDWRQYHSGKTDIGHCPPLSDTERLRALPTGIVVLFHLGHHMQLPLRLAQAGLSFDIVLDRSVYRRSQPLFDRLQEEMNIHGRQHAYLFSDDPSLLLRVRERLRKGRHLLVFADAASGAASPSTAKDVRVPIPFLQGELWLKKGIPLMAYLFDVALYPICYQHTTECPSYVLHEPLAVRKQENREDFIRRALCQCYGLLAETVSRRPWVWECWPYLHSNGMLQIVDVDMLSVLKNDPMLLLPLDNKNCLFDRRYYYARTLTF